MSTLPLFDSSGFITLRVQHWIEEKPSLWNLVLAIWNDHHEFAEALNLFFFTMWQNNGTYNIPAYVLYNENMEEIEGTIIHAGGSSGNLINWEVIANHWNNKQFKNLKPKKRNSE